MKSFLLSRTMEDDQSWENWVAIAEAMQDELAGEGLPFTNEGLIAFGFERLADLVFPDELNLQQQLDLAAALTHGVDEGFTIFNPIIQTILEGNLHADLENAAAALADVEPPEVFHAQQGYESEATLSGEANEDMEGSGKKKGRGYSKFAKNLMKGIAEGKKEIGMRQIVKEEQEYVNALKQQIEAAKRMPDNKAVMAQLKAALEDARQDREEAYADYKDLVKANTKEYKNMERLLQEGSSGRGLGPSKMKVAPAPEPEEKPMRVVRGREASREYAAGQRARAAERRAAEAERRAAGPGATYRGTQARSPTRSPPVSPKVKRTAADLENELRLKYLVQPELNMSVDQLQKWKGLSQEVKEMLVQEAAETGDESHIVAALGEALQGFGHGTHRESVLHKLGLADKSYSLAQLAKFSGVPKHLLQEVYNRGVGAYKTQPKSVRTKVGYVKNTDAPMSKKLSKEQWGMARVYSFLDGNPKHDNDIRYNRGPLKGGAIHSRDQVEAAIKKRLEPFKDLPLNVMADYWKDNFIDIYTQQPLDETSPSGIVCCVQCLNWFQGSEVLSHSQSPKEVLDEEGEVAYGLEQKFKCPICSLDWNEHPPVPVVIPKSLSNDLNKSVRASISPLATAGYKRQYTGEGRRRGGADEGEDAELAALMGEMKVAEAPKESGRMAPVPKGRRKPKAAPAAAAGGQEEERLAGQKRKKMTGEGKGKKWIQGVVSSPSFKSGAFTKEALRHGLTPKQYAKEVLQHPEEHKLTTRRRAQFVQNVGGALPYAISYE